MTDQPKPETGTVAEAEQHGAEEASGPEDEVRPPAESADEQYQDLYDQFVRLQADFENYRKRVEQEKEYLLKYGSQRTMEELLPVMDNLERGTGSLSETSDPKLLYQSFRLVYNELMSGLQQLGLRKIDALGQPFDPSFHEAVSRVESDEYPEDVVANELQTGFMLHDKVLRPAMVQVSNGNATGASEEPQEPEEKGSSENPFRQ